MENLAKNRQECHIMTRVNGWIVPKHSGNPGKQAEYADRKMYSYDVAMEHQFLQ